MIKMDKAIIYLRTSTEEQNPKNQLKDCEALINKLDLKNYEVLPEQQSAFKDVGRGVFENIKQSIKKKEIKFLICWDLDRLFRNRKKLIEFFEFCKIYNCKIYSVRQEWLESLNNIQEPFNEIMHNLMLQIMGWLSEDESKKKSERVKSAIRKKDNKTISYKGNAWGRKALSKNVRKEILEKHKQGLSIREIAQSVWYWDKNNNRKFVSKSLVHKTIQENNSKP
jgi:DNA invertase Pin-like site-specific DNA recombinase